MSQVLDRARNGVDTQQMYGTLDAIKADPSLARFQFRVQNEWVDGAHNRSTIRGFYGAGQQDTSRAAAFTIDAGAFMHPLGANRAYDLLGDVALGRELVLH